MQGCLKSSLSALRAGSSVERGPFYVAFFNFAIGVERLLKVLLLLDHWQRDRRFPNNSELKRYGGRSGHDVEMLYASAKVLFARYGLPWPPGFEPDDIDRRLLGFLSDFAKSSRYFNLDTLAGAAKSADPLAAWEALLDDVYEEDVPELKRVSNEAQVDTVVELTEAHVVHIPSTSMGGETQSYRDLCQDHEKLALVLPEMCWRLVKILVPLKELLITIRQRAQEEDLRRGGEVSVPFMEEFLDFVCKDKTIILDGEDWP